ncbi:MAG: HAMP domain-containing histidine kinase [Thaumarchaeota archaeon]|nr:HAMP domain-containing histidine kinase [Nitrososphaerota archaeon]
MFAKTSLKLSGTVGIIILLLGMTILFGTYQMSKVSSEIIMISEAYEPLQEILSDIQLYHANQANNFDKIMISGQNSPELEQAKEEFWSSNILIQSKLEQAKKLTQTGFSVAPESTESNFKLIHQMFSEIEQSHTEYETLAKAALAAPQGEAFLNQIDIKQEQIKNKIGSTSSEIDLFNEQAITSIEDHERGWLIVQIGIIIVVGAIALVLRHFFGQINSELKKEIDYKTQELQQANKKLQDLDKLKDEFISIASHELKSPIQPIFGFAELAQSGDIDQKEAWDGVTTLAKKLQDLANDVLDVTRIESNRLSIYTEKLSINEIIQDVAKMARTGLSSDLKILEELDSDIEIQADRTRLEQVLRNMVNNSIKFTEQGSIKIKTIISKKSNEVIISVSDTGLGIPDDILPKIFGKFVTKGHERENQGGNGLGLFLCKGIIDAHGGRISAKNNKDGGATFEFSLPITPKNTVESITN